MTVALAAGLLHSVARAAAPFSFTAPATFRAPLISHARMGTTYAYLPDDSAETLRLTITAMPASEVRAHLGRLSSAECTALFVDALRDAHQQFFVAAQERSLSLGAHALVQRRWTGEKDGKAVTGIVACAEIDGYYYAVDFIDELHDALHSFPSIRTSLRRFSTRSRADARP
ncbi:MAG: hypothetical protein WD928_13780 [Gammaproteobacteria bacterium]